MPKLSEKGVIQILIPLILLAGLVAGVYLVQQTQIFKPKAGGGPIWFTDINGNTLPVNSQNIPQTTSPTVKIQLISTLGPPASPTVGTVSYKIAENPTDLTSALDQSYTKEPTVIDYTFKDSSLGSKFIWVEFKDNSGKTDRRSAQIEIIGPSGGTGGSQTNLQIGDWKVQTSLPVPTFGHGFVAGLFGYLVSIEGVTIADNPSDKVYYAKIKSIDGTIGSWTATKSLPSTRQNSSVYSDGGLIYVVGGAGPFPGSSTSVKKILNDVLWAKQNTDGTISSWNTTTVLPTALSRPAITAANGYLYSIGGINDIQTTEEVYVSKANSDFSLNDWEKLTSLPKSIVNHSVVVDAGKHLYVIGGLTDDSRFPFGITSDVYVTTLNTDGTIGSWNKTTSLPVPLAGHASVFYNGFIVVLGGNSDSKAVNTVYASKINTDGTLGNWTAMKILPKPLEALQATIANNRIYIGGGISSGTATNSVYMADVSISSSTPTPTPTSLPTPTPTPTVLPSPSPTPAARSIKITYPNGGETFKVGDKVKITWTSSKIDKVSLGYSFGVGSLNPIVSNITNQGSYDWTVNIGNTANTKVKIDIIGYETGVGSLTDQSDDFFTVLPTSSFCNGIGDVNQDGIITATDSLRVLRIVAGLFTPTAEQTRRADVTGDGKITATDALQIQRYIAGLIKTFPVCPQ